MKFLCVPCDTPMKLRNVDPPEHGSLSVVYACPACGYEIAMLTNAYETQVVRSLGVRIGPPDRSADGTALRPADGANGGGCPFTMMIPAPSDASADMIWTPAAEARLTNIPEFVRPMARTGIERFARERGVAEIDDRVLDAARDFFGM